MYEMPDHVVVAYLERIGFSGEVTHDVATLQALQRAHMTAVPFENLHVFHRVGVRTDAAWSVPKIVDDRRGGWCFELNGAFGELLIALGFSVRRLAAAVLLDGPNDTVDHLALEVELEESWLVDVGFGDSAIRPLRLNDHGPQDGGTGTFQFMPSSKGLTLTEHVDDVPAARYRFKRVAHELDDFDPASNHLQSTEGLHWTTRRFATRLLGNGPDRITLLDDRLKVRRTGEPVETPVEPGEWDAVLAEHFELTVPAADEPGAQ